MTRPMPGPPAYGHYPNYYPHEHPDDALGLCPGCDIDDQAERAAPPKRLTGIGCAAERGEARADWMHMKFLIASRQVVSMRARPNAPMPEPSPPLERKLDEARDRFYTWLRFATRPHALEES